jgi:hypothetical protein
MTGYKSKKKAASAKTIDEVNWLDHEPDGRRVSQEPVGEVNRYGLDSHGRKWHAIYLWAQWPNKEKNT